MLTLQHYSEIPRSRRNNKDMVETENHSVREKVCVIINQQMMVYKQSAQACLFEDSTDYQSVT